MNRRMKSDQVRTNWRDVLEYVRGGGTVVVEHYNRPVADITPHKENGMDITVKLDEKIAIETPTGSGRVVQDSWKHADDPWLWEYTDRSHASDESGIAQHEMRYSARRFTSQWDALADLLRSVQSETADQS